MLVEEDDDVETVIEDDELGVNDDPELEYDEDELGESSLVVELELDERELDFELDIEKLDMLDS